MRRIETSKYSEYIEYAKECTANHVYPLSIATGTQDGDIYIDDKGCVMFWHACGFVYISGNVGPDALETIYQEFLVKDSERRFLLITDSELVTEYYASHDSLLLENRIEYVHSGILGNPPVLEDGFEFERITRENIGDIRGRIIPSFSWKSDEVFLRNGFGFMARSKENGSFAAVAFSSAVSPEEVDIGVETIEAFRYHGLASCLAYRMCMEIIHQGRKPVWAHAETNKGSQRTALSVGFKPCRINTVIHKRQ